MKSTRIRDQIIQVDEVMGSHELVWCPTAKQEIELESRIIQRYLTGQIRSWRVNCANPCGREDCVYKTNPIKGGERSVFNTLKDGTGGSSTMPNVTHIYGGVQIPAPCLKGE